MFPVCFVCTEVMEDMARKVAKGIVDIDWRGRRERERAKPFFPGRSEGSVGTAVLSEDEGSSSQDDESGRSPAATLAHNSAHRSHRRSVNRKRSGDLAALFRILRRHPFQGFPERLAAAFEILTR